MKKLLICLFALFSLVVLIVGPVNANNIDPSDFMGNAEKYRGKQINGITITTIAPLDPAADYDATAPDGDKAYAAEQVGAIRQNQPGA